MLGKNRRAEGVGIARAAGKMATTKTITIKHNRPTASSEGKMASRMDVINKHPRYLPIIICSQESQLQRLLLR